MRVPFGNVIPILPDPPPLAGTCCGCSNDGCIAALSSFASTTTPTGRNSMPSGASVNETDALRTDSQLLAAVKTRA